MATEQDARGKTVLRDGALFPEQDVYTGHGRKTILFSGTPKAGEKVSLGQIGTI